MEIIKEDQRIKRAKLNISFSLGAQFISIVCGLIVPKVMINSFGSEAYGATASIGNFLAYITLLEGGVGGVARASLYKPLAEKNNEQISDIIFQIKNFFRIIALVFIVYVVILSISFKTISKVEAFDWITSVLLVVVISISTFAQYFIGISYTILIQADQKTYITQIISIITIIGNTILTIVLIALNCNLIVVKLISSIVFAAKPFLTYAYVKKKYIIIKPTFKSTNLLDQKWSGLGQHFAFFLHSNTDVAVLTIWANLKIVAVYSVYNMIVSNMQNFCTAFISGAEAMFGDMIAKGEYKDLNKTFQIYETIISFMGIVIYSLTASLIVPFVRLYARGVSDANYIVPFFALLLTLSSLLYCLRQPYHLVAIAAGHFKQTQIAAYGEALINIIISLFLVGKFKLIGVAIGTLTAVIFRYLFYVFYLRKNILRRKLQLFIKRFIVNSFSFVLILLICNQVQEYVGIDTFSEWLLVGTINTIISVSVMLTSVYVFYRTDVMPLISNLSCRLLKKRIHQDNYR